MWETQFIATDITIIRRWSHDGRVTVALRSCDGEYKLFITCYLIYMKYSHEVKKINRQSSNFEIQYLDKGQSQILFYVIQKINKNLML